MYKDDDEEDDDSSGDIGDDDGKWLSEWTTGIYYHLSYPLSF